MWYLSENKVIASRLINRKNLMIFHHAYMVYIMMMLIQTIYGSSFKKQKGEQFISYIYHIDGTPSLSLA